MAKIVISGFMGSGKTTVGKKLSEVLSLPFFDLDFEIEKRLGKSIGEIFKDDGEKFFREIEKELLQNFLKREGDFVLSVGGGAVVNHESLDCVLKNSIPILLDGRGEVFYERIKDDGDRPLATSLDEFILLFNKRKKFYKKIPIKVDGEKRVDDVVKDILSLFEEKVFYKPHRIRIRVGSSFDIRNREDFFIVDEVVYRMFKGRFPEEFKGYTLSGGERAKSMDEVLKIYESLAHSSVGRDDRVICVGGGVTSDLGGFVASTYMRGIGLSIFPTTLLSQVDSSIGGKNGVNLYFGKNLVGTVYMPEDVFIDPSFLWTLPKREILSGLGEIFKYSILSENGIFEVLETEDATDFMVIHKLIYPSILEKIKWIKDDIFDRKGRRIFLNFGHTIGHMVEKVFGFGKIKHGEAVSFGILTSSYISNRFKRLKDFDFERIFSLYRKLGFSIKRFYPLLNIKKDTLIETVLFDKKRRDNFIPVILPEAIGSVSLSRDFKGEDIIDLLFDFLKESRRSL